MNARIDGGRRQSGEIEFLTSIAAGPAATTATAKPDRETTAAQPDVIRRLMDMPNYLPGLLPYARVDMAI